MAATISTILSCPVSFSCPTPSFLLLHGSMINSSATMAPNRSAKVLVSDYFHQNFDHSSDYSLTGVLSC